MPEDNLMCLCGWIGARQELVCIDGDEDSFTYCPDCNNSDDLELEKECVDV
jgi:hypothetical protein